MRPLAYAVVPIAKDVEQASWAFTVHAFVIHGDWYDLRAFGGSSLDGGHVRKFFDEDAWSFSDRLGLVRPRIDEQLQRLGEAIRVTARQDGLWARCVWNVRMQMVTREASQEGP